jgi:hypothetical protein
VSDSNDQPGIFRFNGQKRRVLIRCAAAVTAPGLPVLSTKAGTEERTAAGIDVHIELQAVQDSVTILPGAQTRVWRY